MNKFCVTCRFIVDTNRESFEKCGHPAFSPINPVTGKPSTVYCSSARMSGGHCGPHGKLWQSNAEPATVTPEERKMLMTALQEGRI